MIYLNNSATTYPKPQEVIKAISNAFLTYEGDSSRLFNGDSINSDIISMTRKRVAEFFNIKESINIIFTSGSTESLNLLIRGFEYRHKRVVTTVTEHNSVLRPLYRIQKESSIELSFIPCNSDGYIDLEVLKKELSKPFDYFIINHSSNVTGSIQNLEKIGQIVKNSGGFFAVDASQSAGAEYINVQKSEIDFMAFTGHKSLYGVSGCGGFYVSNNIKTVLNPLKVGGTGVRSSEKSQPQELPLYYEAGTKNYIGILSLYHGVSFVEKITIDTIKKHKNRMAFLAYENLKDIK
ncbi:aminotransferase class V-fold PLP-dependent enzyme, partial [bacterium]|nr:aminotransferase class V-fold PLP-dependent enzyme [bacterium]